MGWGRIRWGGSSGLARFFFRTRPKDLYVILTKMQVLAVFAGGPSPPASENRPTTLHHPHRHYCRPLHHLVKSGARPLEESGKGKGKLVLRDWEIGG